MDQVITLEMNDAQRYDITRNALFWNVLFCSEQTLNQVPTIDETLRYMNCYLVNVQIHMFLDESEILLNPNDD